MADDFDKNKALLTLMEKELLSIDQIKLIIPSIIEDIEVCDKQNFAFLMSLYEKDIITKDVMLEKVKKILMYSLDKDLFEKVINLF